MFPACLFREFLVWWVHELKMLYIRGRDPFTLSQQTSPAPRSASFLVNLRNRAHGGSPSCPPPLQSWGGGWVECAEGASWVNRTAVPINCCSLCELWAASQTGEELQIPDCDRSADAGADCATTKPCACQRSPLGGGSAELTATHGLPLQCVAIN